MKPLLGHAPAQGCDHLGAQHDVAVQAVAAKVEVTVLQPQLLGIVRLAEHRHGQFGGVGQHLERLDPNLDLAGRQAGVRRFRRACGDHLAVDLDHALGAGAFGEREAGRGRRQHELGDAVVVAQVNEHQPAMVALPVHPAGQAHAAPHVRGAERATSVGTVGVHGGAHPVTLGGEDARPRRSVRKGGQGPRDPRHVKDRRGPWRRPALCLNSGRLLAVAQPDVELFQQLDRRLRDHRAGGKMAAAPASSRAWKSDGGMTPPITTMMSPRPALFSSAISSGASGQVAGCEGGGAHRVRAGGDGVARGLGRRLEQGPDLHLEAQVGEGGSHHLLPPVMAVLAHLGDVDARRASV